MTVLTDQLTAALLLGSLPEWTALERMKAGEELREALGALADAESARTELEAVQQVLVDFGALAEDDYVTAASDLLEILLPPAVVG